MSVFWDATNAAFAAAGLLPALGSRTVALRPRPLYLPALDAAPLLIISPDPTRWERVAGLTLKDGADNNVLYQWPVLASLVLADAADVTQTRWLLDMRDALRKALWVTALAGAAEVYDCDYEPNPKGVDVSGLSEASFFSVQQFTYSIRGGRTS